MCHKVSSLHIYLNCLAKFLTSCWRRPLCPMTSVTVLLTSLTVTVTAVAPAVTWRTRGSLPPRETSSSPRRHATPPSRPSPVSASDFPFPTREAREAIFYSVRKYWARTVCFSDANLFQHIQGEAKLASLESKLTSLKRDLLRLFLARTWSGLV